MQPQTLQPQTLPPQTLFPLRLLPLRLLPLAGAGFAALACLDPAQAATGLSFSSSGVVGDRLDIQQQRVIANLWTSYLVPLQAGARFFSDRTPPAPGHRVTLINTTPGFDGEPFTERDYSDAAGSELILLLPSAEHQTRTFSVLPGSLAAPKQNDFRYEIRNASGEVVEQGNFAVQVGLNDSPIATVYRKQDSPALTHGFVPNYYDAYAGYGYGGFYGRQRSLFPRSHYRDRPRLGDHR